MDEQRWFVLLLAEGTAAMVGIVFRTITTTARMNAMMLSLGFVCAINLIIQYLKVLFQFVSNQNRNRHWK